MKDKSVKEIKEIDEDEFGFSEIFEMKIVENLFKI